MGAGEVLLVLLAVAGLCSLMQLLMRILYRSGKKIGTLLLVLHFTGHCEDAEYELRCARSRLREAEGFAQKRLLVVDDGMDEQTKKICALYLYRTPGVTYCTAASFAKMEALQYTEIN
ncbi:MAG: hypothetical protein LKE53_07085 [Oscillospiraceae bacterium]|jgi:hypothetical protein|nr:hypothetical protein [Oscillospiraceae bacterium]MDD3262005.1 hypothetical protein [Oscillospiraceae bacterium]